MSDLLRSTYHTPEQYTPDSWTRDLKAGFEPWNPTDIIVETVYKIDFNEYEFFIELAFATESRLVYQLTLPRDALLDLYDPKESARYIGQSIAEWFRKHRLITPEENIELGEN